MQDRLERLTLRILDMLTRQPIVSFDQADRAVELAIHMAVHTMSIIQHKSEETRDLELRKALNLHFDK